LLPWSLSLKCYKIKELICSIKTNEKVGINARGF